MPQRAQAARLPAAAASLSHRSSGLLSLRQNLQAPGRDAGPPGGAAGPLRGPAPVGNNALPPERWARRDIASAHSARSAAHMLGIQNQKSAANSIRKHSTQQQLFKLKCADMCPCPSCGYNLTHVLHKMCNTRTLKGS